MDRLSRAGLEWRMDRIGKLCVRIAEDPNAAPFDGKNFTLPSDPYRQRERY
ncbi:MAG: hypothetical protein IPK63_12705 [Candidatus Competibacteraceae bacterium]|nr:hypothetical protein [Candidatus Competibacteraceae bacterium]